MLCLEFYLILCRRNVISCIRNRLYHVEPLLYYNNDTSMVVTTNYSFVYSYFLLLAVPMRVVFK